MHALNADRLQDNLCPQFDVSFAALMDDLTERGLLDETLVVVIGEFGRTPKINANGGRDHWGNVFSFAMAGAGIRGGQVLGASDRQGAYPQSEPYTGGDLTATLFHLLGIDTHSVFHDRFKRPHSITKGKPMEELLAATPAKITLCQSQGNPALVPPFDTRLLFDTSFETDLSLVPPAPPTRDKGWRASPIAGPESTDGLTVQRQRGSAKLGYGLANTAQTRQLAPGTRALLAQEIRGARGGQYKLSIRAEGVASNAEEFEKQFLSHCVCRLVLFRFGSIDKDPRSIQELGSAEFKPVFGKVESFVLERFLGSTTPGANFAIGNGLGILISVEKTSGSPLTLAANDPRFAALRIESVELTFSPRVRDDSVTV